MENAEVSKCLAFGMDLPEFNGKVFRLGEVTQGLKAEYELYLKRQAMEGTIQAGQGLPPAEDEKNRKILLKDFGLGKYRWGGEVWRESLSQEDTMQELIVLLLAEGEIKKGTGRPINRELVGQMLEVETIGPWLLGAVYMVSGADPTLALTMAKMAFDQGKTNQAEALERMKMLITPISADLSSKTSPNSGATSNT